MAAQFTMALCPAPGPLLDPNNPSVHEVAQLGRHAVAALLIPAVDDATAASAASAFVQGRAPAPFLAVHAWAPPLWAAQCPPLPQPQPRQRLQRFTSAWWACGRAMEASFQRAFLPLPMHAQALWHATRWRQVLGRLLWAKLL